MYQKYVPFTEGMKAGKDLGIVVAIQTDAAN